MFRLQFTITRFSQRVSHVFMVLKNAASYTTNLTGICHVILKLSIPCIFISAYAVYYTN